MERLLTPDYQALASCVNALKSEIVSMVSEKDEMVRRRKGSELNSKLAQLEQLQQELQDMWESLPLYRPDFAQVYGSRSDQDSDQESDQESAEEQHN